MSILTSSQVARMQGALGAMQTDSAQILVPTEVRSAGGSHLVYTPGATVPADLRAERTSTETDAQGRLVAVEAWSIRLPAGTAVGVKARLLIGGRTFEVIGRPTRSSRELTRRVRAVEVT